MIDLHTTASPLSQKVYGDYHLTTQLRHPLPKPGTRVGKLPLVGLCCLNSASRGTLIARGGRARQTSKADKRGPVDGGDIRGLLYSTLA